MGVEAVDVCSAKSGENRVLWALKRPADGKTRGSIYTAMKRAELEAVGGDNAFGVTFQLVIHR